MAARSCASVSEYGASLVPFLGYTAVAGLRRLMLATELSPMGSKPVTVPSKELTMFPRLDPVVLTRPAAIWEATGTARLVKLAV